MDTSVVSLEEARRAHHRSSRVTVMKILDPCSFDLLDRAKWGRTLHFTVRVQQTCARFHELFSLLEVGQLRTIEISVDRLDTNIFRGQLGHQDVSIMRIGDSWAIYVKAPTTLTEHEGAS